MEWGGAKPAPNQAHQMEHSKGKHRLPLRQPHRTETLSSASSLPSCPPDHLAYLSRHGQLRQRAFFLQLAENGSITGSRQGTPTIGSTLGFQPQAGPALGERTPGQPVIGARGKRAQCAPMCMSTQVRLSLPLALAQARASHCSG